MKIYKAKITGFFLYFLLLYTFAVTVFVLFNPEVLTDKPAIVCILLLPSVYMTWVCFHTKYYLEGEKLKYVSGFVTGEIPITSITTIVKNKSMWHGLRPALAQKGIIIHFNRFDEIYLAPVSNDELVADLLSINKQIEVS
jgi:Bacterial PH domain